LFKVLTYPHRLLGYLTTVGDLIGGRLVEGQLGNEDYLL